MRPSGEARSMTCFLCNENCYLLLSIHPRNVLPNLQRSKPRKSSKRNNFYDLHRKLSLLEDRIAHADTPHKEQARNVLPGEYISTRHSINIGLYYDIPSLIERKDCKFRIPSFIGLQNNSKKPTCIRDVAESESVRAVFRAETKFSNTVYKSYSYTSIC